MREARRRMSLKANRALATYGRNAIEPARSSAYVFGAFTLLPRRRILLKSGERVELGDRALDLLTILVERAGEVVGKTELMARAWPDVFVDDISLRVNISALRRALGDDRKDQIFIRNVVGRGYCFVENVASGPDNSPGDGIAHPGGARGQLPALVHHLIGRDALIASLARQVARHRLVSLVGAPGIGKSSVAIAVARALAPHFTDPVRFIDFSGLAAEQDVRDALAAILDGEGHYAAQKTGPRLILFDNCEHLVHAAARKADRLRNMAPDIHILVTSREPLRAEGEQVHRLPPLDSPAAGKDWTVREALGFPAVELFVERARAIDDQFAFRSADVAAVADICRRLEGVPLAIEFAAGYVEMLGLADLSAMLGDERLLMSRAHRGMRSRQQTLRASLAWSYDLLPPAEQAVLGRLATLDAGFTMASAIAAAPEFDANEMFASIVNLVEKSLLAADATSGEARYSLQEILRVFLIAQRE